MTRLIKRAWRYLEAALERRLEQAADPRLQIEQAIEEAKRQHALLTQAAASVVGNERELDIKLNRALDSIERLKASIAHAIRMEDRVRREGDPQKAAQFASAAEALAGRLAGIEANTADLGELRSRAIEQNAQILRQKITVRSRLLTELEAVRMQERLNVALGSMAELAPASDVPTLDEVQAKLDQRYANAMGTAEIAAASIETRLLEVDASVIEQQGLRRLEEIRQSIKLDEP